MKAAVKLLLTLPFDEVARVQQGMRKDKGVLFDVNPRYGPVARSYPSDRKIVVSKPANDNRTLLVETVADDPNIMLDTDAISEFIGWELTFYSSAAGT